MRNLLMNKRPVTLLLLLASVFLLTVATLAQTSDNGSQAGTAVVNQAGGAYQSDGNNLTGTSATVSETVKAVAGVRVTPDETSPSANTAPSERTYLTTGILWYAIESQHRGGFRIETPDLDIRYKPYPVPAKWPEVLK